MGLRGREARRRTSEGQSLQEGNVGGPFSLHGCPDDRCRHPHPGHFPADVDLEAGI